MSDKVADGEDGSIVPAASAMIAALLVIGLAMFAVTTVYTAKVRVQMTADLAALAAAGQAPSSLWGPSPDATIACEFAREVADRNDGVLKDCWAENGDIRVIIGRSLQWQGVTWQAVARARAGPVGPN